MNMSEILPGVKLDEPINLSRRRFLASTAVGALVIGFGLPLGSSRVQAATGVAERGTQVPAFLEIRPDGSVRLLSPFMEGGQGTHTAMAQIIGEELDADPATFIVEAAPPGEAYVVMENGLRITGGSMSVRMSYPTMRRLGALARAMLMQAGAEQLRVPLSELTTQPGRVVHAASGRSVGYGELAGRALDMPVPDPLPSPCATLASSVGSASRSNAWMPMTNPPARRFTPSTLNSTTCSTPPSSTRRAWA